MIKKIRDKFLIILIIAAYVVILGLGIGVGYWLSDNSWENRYSQELEQEYYRGIYDACMQVMYYHNICDKRVWQIYMSNWYQIESGTFVWPPEYKIDKFATPVIIEDSS